MEIDDRIKVGYTSDFFNMATKKYHILDETISGRFVCEGMPEVISRLDGSKYVSSPMTGLFLRDKRDFTNIKEEELK